VKDKCDFIEKSQAEVVIATDSGCLMNMGGCLHRRSSRVRTVHLAEVLSQI
jgi:L-lactate dehydrogenase complex protein LldE